MRGKLANPTLFPVNAYQLEAMTNVLERKRCIDRERSPGRTGSDYGGQREISGPRRGVWDKTNECPLLAVNGHSVNEW